MKLIIAKNLVSIQDLIGVETPAPTDSFMPIPHHTLVEMVREALTRAGLTIVAEEHSLSKGGQRYFGGFAVTGAGMDGADRVIVVGVRNSHDKAFAAAICIGNRMTVCENLCFSSDVKLARRHTLNILKDLPRVISDAVARIVSHWNDMGQRIEAYKAKVITEEQAAALIVKFVDAKAYPLGDIYHCVKEFRNPRHEEFKGSTLWTLYNAVTETLKGRDINVLAFRTMTVQSILDPVAGHTPVIEVQEIVTVGCESNPEPAGTDYRQDAIEVESEVVWSAQDDEMDGDR